MSDFHNAFEAFLATPNDESQSKGSQGAGISSATPSPQPQTSRQSKRSVVVKALSPEVEISSAPLRKSTRRRKRIDSDSSSSHPSDLEDVICLNDDKEEEREDKNDEDFFSEAKPSVKKRMPSSRRLSQEGKGVTAATNKNANSRSGRRLKAQAGRKDDKAPLKGVNGAGGGNTPTTGRRRRSLVEDKESADGDGANTPDDSIVVEEDDEESEEEEEEEEEEEGDEEEEKIDLWIDTACRLCDKKDFTPETESLVRHYASAHFKARLDAELRPHSDFSCNVCKAKRLKHVFATRREFASHMAIFHNRVAIWLADELGVEVIDTKPKTRLQPNAATSGRSSSLGRRGASTAENNSFSSSKNGKASPSVADGAQGKRRSQRYKKPANDADKSKTEEIEEDTESTPEVIELDDTSSKGSKDGSSEESDEEEEPKTKTKSESKSTNDSQKPPLPKKRGRPSHRRKVDKQEDAASSDTAPDNHDNEDVEDEEVTMKIVGTSRRRSSAAFQDCQLCSASLATETQAKRHAILKHFAKKLQTDGSLPTKKPFSCGQKGCNFEGDTLANLTMHFGIKHKGVNKYMQEVVGTPTRSRRLSDAAKKLEDKEAEAKKKECWVLDKRPDRSRSNGRGRPPVGGAKASKSESWVVSSVRSGKGNGLTVRKNDPVQGGAGDDESDLTDGEQDEISSSADSSSGSAGAKPILRKNGGSNHGTPPPTSGAAGANSSSAKKSNYRHIKNRSKEELMREFQLALKENLRTKDGAHCQAKDETSVICVCGKVIRVCNPYYWKYLAQKPKVVDGKLLFRGHWYTCEEVKKRGSDYRLAQQELDEAQRELEQSKKGIKRQDSGDSEASEQRKKMRTRTKTNHPDFEMNDFMDDDDDDFDAEDGSTASHDENGDEDGEDNRGRRGSTEAEDREAALAKEKRQAEVRANLQKVLSGRTVGETFMQDGPCYLAAAELSLCRECKQVPRKEQEDLILSGQFSEESSNLTCSFYAFRKLRLTRNGYLMVDGYLDPMKDPKEADIALWTPDKSKAALSKTVSLERVIYILSLIGDQFCNMVQQERKSYGLHLSGNKTVAWKRPVRGVREMCDVCKTTLFNHHWICGVCGLYVCLDCYQYRRGGLVKDISDDTMTDDYKWPYCTSEQQHQINNLMLAVIIPKQCMLDLAKKLHKLRLKWKIPQFCHQKDELHGLYAQDDGFLSLQPSTVNLINAARNVFFPCQLCSNETFRWQFDLFKHYATKHFYDDLFGMLQAEQARTRGVVAGTAAQSSFRCPVPGCPMVGETEHQIVIHYGLNHRFIVKVLEANKLSNSHLVQKSGTLQHQQQLQQQQQRYGSNILGLTTTFKCPICGATIPARMRSDHLTVHFKDKMSPLLRKEAPFSCPKCRYVAMDRTSLIRHFATKHGLIEAYVKDWLERQGRHDEVKSYVNPAPPPPRSRPLDPNTPECRLCEEFPSFSKNFEFHKHLTDVHFRMELNNDVRQMAPFVCPSAGCSYESKSKTLLLSHYGVTHKAVFKHYNRVMGLKGDGPPIMVNNYTSGKAGALHFLGHTGRGGGSVGRPRGSYSTRGGRAAHASTQPCLICEEYVSPETMVFHLAHKHFQEKIAHLPKTRPFKCPNCPHINEFQGGLVKHYGNFHGIFNQTLKDMGLMDERDTLIKSGIKFSRPAKIEKMTGPNSNLSLELARTAAIWSGAAREEEDLLKEVAQLRELERKVEQALQSKTANQLKGENGGQTAGRGSSAVVVKEEPGAEPQIKKEGDETATDADLGISEREEKDDDRTFCLLCDNCPAMQTKSELLRHLVEKHFKQKMYSKLIYRSPQQMRQNSSSGTLITTEDGTVELTPVMRGVYKCPLCEFENHNQMNTARHYGIKHRIVHKLYEEIVCRSVFRPPPSKDGSTDGKLPRGRPPLSGSMSVGMAAFGANIRQEPKVHICKICNVEHDSLASYQRHLIKVHFKTKLLSYVPKVKPFICPNEGCTVERRDRFNLLMHFGGCQRRVWNILEEMPEGSVENLNDTSKSKCRLCGRYFTSSRYMWGHLGEDHFQKDLDSELPKEAPWKCPKCPIDNAYIGSDLRSLRTHYGTRHKAVMPFLAKALNITLDDLRKEFLPPVIETPAAGGPSGGSIVCQFCNKAFLNQMDFNKHFLLHVRKRVFQDLPEAEPFKCPRCPYEGGTRINLLLHYGLQHNVVTELMNEEPSKLMVDMDFITKKNGTYGDEERISELAEVGSLMMSPNHGRGGAPGPSNIKAMGINAGVHPPAQVERPQPTERYHPELDNKRFPKCKLCSYRYFTRLDLYRHFADNHLREKLCEALGPDAGPDGVHKCPEPNCRAELKSRQAAWRHYACKHGHLQRLMESELKFKQDEWSNPMKDIDNAKSAEEKKNLVEKHKEAMKQHQEATSRYHEEYQRYQMEMQNHNHIVQQARHMAAQEHAETLAAQALASMAGAPYQQQRMSPNIHIPPPPVPPQPPQPPPPAPPAIKPTEDPTCLDVTVLPTIEFLDNPKTAQNVCELCGEEFTNTNKTRDKGNHQVNHFRDYLLQAIPPNTMNCPKCSFIGRDRNALLKHVGLSHRVVNSAVRREMGGTIKQVNEVTHDCKVCSQFFLNQNSLNNHLCDSHYFNRLAKDIVYSSQPPFRCPKCAYEAKSHPMTVRHYGIKHGLVRNFMIEDGYLPREPSPPPPPPPRPPPPTYPDANYKQSLMNHVNTGHYNASSSYGQNQSPRYQGGQSSWMDLYGNSPHNRSQHEEVVITCPVANCSQSFPNAPLLFRHATEQHFFERFSRELPVMPPFSCPICCKVYPDQVSLVRHWGVSHQMAVKVFNEHLGRPNSFDVSILKKFEIRGFREMCPLCKGPFHGRQLLMRHLADTHFKDRMCNNMPDREGLVYQCPQCSHVARDRQSFVRHYGIVHKMVIKYLNEMGIHTLDDEKSAPPSPATPQSNYSHNDSFSPRPYNDPMGSPGYYSPHTPQRSPFHTMEANHPQYSSSYPSPQYKSPQYLNHHSPRNSIASPQDLSMQQYASSRGSNAGQPYSNQYDPRYSQQPQDLSSSAQQPQDLSRTTGGGRGALGPQDLSAKGSQPIDFSNHGQSPAQQSPASSGNYPSPTVPQANNHSNQQQHYPTVSSGPGTGPNQPQKPLNVMINDPYRQAPHTPGGGVAPMTPGSQQHSSNPGTPQPPHTPHLTGSQPGTPQPIGAVHSPAAYRQPATPQPVYANHMDFASHSGGQVANNTASVIQMNPQHTPVHASPQHVMGTSLPGHSSSGSAFHTQKSTASSDYIPSGDEHIQAPDPDTRGPFSIYCMLCETVKAKLPSDFYRHLAEIHFKSQIARCLPPPGDHINKCPLCSYENKEMSPMIRHYGVSHKKVREIIGNQVVGKYVPESLMLQHQQQQRSLKAGFGHHSQYEGVGPSVMPNPASVEGSHHSRSASPGGQSTVKCPAEDCEMEFTARYTFWQHMCDKHLKEELLKQIPHGPNQPLVCPAPGCNYTTKDSRQALVRHYGMTHKVVQSIMHQKYPEFMTYDRFSQPPKQQRARSKTPVRMPPAGMPSSYNAYQHGPVGHAPDPYVHHIGQMHLSQPGNHPPPQPQPHVVHPQGHPAQVQYPPSSYHASPQQPPHQPIAGFGAPTAHHQPAPANHPHHPHQPSASGGHQAFHGQEQYDVNLDHVNPSDFSIPSLSDFLDNPSASFPNMPSEEASSSSSYIVHHSAPNAHHTTMQFEPQIDGTFDPTSINDQSLDGSGSASNPTTPEKNKTSFSPAQTETNKQTVNQAIKYCELCGKQYEGKNRGMNKMQHMVHHFKEQLYQSLPPKVEGDPLPFKCPESDCPFETKHKPDWARHFGSKHKQVEKLLSKYLEEHPEAWANQPENKELLKDNSIIAANSGRSVLIPSTRIVQRSPSVASSTQNSDQLDASEGLMSRMKEIQQRVDKQSASSSTVPLEPTPAQSSRLAVELPKSDLTKFITSALSEKNIPHAVDVGNKKFILSEQQLMEQKVQKVIHEQQQILNNQKGQTVVQVSKPSGSTTAVLALPQQPIPVSMIQQHLTTSISSASPAVTNANLIKTTVPTAEKQEFRTVHIQLPSHLLKQNGPVQLQLSNGQTIQIQPSQVTHHQYLKIQTPQGEQLVRVQTQPSQQINTGLLTTVPQQQALSSTGTGLLIENQPQNVQNRPQTITYMQPQNAVVSSTPQIIEAGGTRRIISHQGLSQSSIPQGATAVAAGPGGNIVHRTVVQQQPVHINTSINHSVNSSMFPNRVMVSAGQPAPTVVTNSIVHQQPVASQLATVAKPINNAQVATIPQHTTGAAAGSSSSSDGSTHQVIHSKLVLHNGRTYLVQVRAQKPNADTGNKPPQALIKTNIQGGSGADGTNLVQEVMDEMIRQQVQKQTEQQKISELAMQLQQQSQHLELSKVKKPQEPQLLQVAQQQPPQQPQQVSKPLTVSGPPTTTTTKLTLQQQQMLLPTEPHPQITAQHKQLQQNRPTTSILQQQLEKGQNASAMTNVNGVHVQDGKTNNLSGGKSESPVQCMLCIEMPWFPNHDHLDNHYSTEHGIMKTADPVDASNELEFSNADLEASLSSMTDLKDDAGDFENFLDALPPSPEAQETEAVASSSNVVYSPLKKAVAGASSNSISSQVGAGSSTRLCELCGFEPKTKNKSRERMDHLAMKHFREQMISELRKDRPLKCPRCDAFESKDRQQLFRHMISKHKVLDFYLAEAVEKMKAEGKQPFTAADGTSNSSLSLAGPQQQTVVGELEQRVSTLPVQATIVESRISGVRQVVLSQSSASQTGPEACGSITLPQFTLPSLSTIVKEPTAAATAGAVPNVAQPQPSHLANAIVEPLPQVCANDLGSSAHVSLADFMDSALLDTKSEKLMQVDGIVDSESDTDSLNPLSPRWQMDGIHDGSDNESTTGPGSEMSFDERFECKGAAKGPCPICKEEMKYSRIYHFAVSHFRPRLNEILPMSRPFTCPECKEEHKHRMNLSSHYLGKHNKFDLWMAEYIESDRKADWVDPNPPNNRPLNRLPRTSGSYKATLSPLAKSAGASTSKERAYSTPGGSSSENGEPTTPTRTHTSPSGKPEWFCQLCHGGISQRKEVHYASVHFQDRLRKILPNQSPFICVVCKMEHKHFMNLSTHYLTQHGYLREWLKAQGIELEMRSRSTWKNSKPGRSPVPLPAKHVLSSSSEAEGDEEESESEDQTDYSFVSSPETLSVKLPQKSVLQFALDALTSDANETTASNQSLNDSRDDKSAAEDSEVSCSSPRKLSASQMRRGKRRRLHGGPIELSSLLRSVATSLSGEDENSLISGSSTAFDIRPCGKDPPPVRTMTFSSIDNPPPHFWLCDGKMLVLEDSQHTGNMRLFQEQWRRGQPIIVANNSKNLDSSLWSPKAFNDEFGHLKHDIINCKTHKVIPQVPLKWFWDGFESLNSRMLDKMGMPMLLKLKDWPPEDDFAQFFPRRYADLMKWLPLPEYTRREGQLNLASFMPEFFVCPDLGPKMYIAYGSALYPECGSTNLHLDMSDAVNLIVHVGIPEDGSPDEQYKAGVKAVDEAGCDLATRLRVREEGVVVGALWHIYHPRDADKIRDFLNKVALEKGQKLEPHNDPIHDQSVYLDGDLRQRLFEEYGVVGYAFPQCEGDTVFIPAGAPHQVRNIHNCIKVAEDFVSPENLEWCFYITEEFRHLTDHHTNHEDKLQIKNILYHAVKECVSYLEYYEENQGLPS